MQINVPDPEFLVGEEVRIVKHPWSKYNGTITKVVSITLQTRTVFEKQQLGNEPDRQNIDWIYFVDLPGYGCTYKAVIEKL